MCRKWVARLSLILALGPLTIFAPARGENPEPRLTLRGHTREIVSLAFSPDGKTLASTAWFEDNVRLWDVATGENRAILKPGGVDNQIQFAPDGKTLFCSSNKPHHIRRGRKRVLDHYTDLLCAWDLQDLTRPCRRIFEGDRHGPHIWDIAMSPDGSVLAAVGEGRTYMLEPPEWQLGRSLQTSGPERADPASFPKGFATRAVFSPDGAILAAQAFPSGVDLWDHKAGRVITTLHSEGDPVCTDLTFSPNGNYLAAHQGDGKGDGLVIWYLRANVPIKRIKFPEGRYCWDNQMLVYSPDGTLLADGDLDGTLHIWQTRDLRERSMIIHAKGVSALAFSPDGKTLASGGKDTLVKLWDVAQLTEHTTGK
jgi:WD40 repeat protein